MSMKAATITGLIFAALCLGLALALQPRPVYHVTPQHNNYELGITCGNGGDPTVKGNFDGMLVVSCGNEQP